MASTSVLCCYPTNAGYIGATSGLLQKTWEQARTELDSSIGLRVLFSAHGLPEAIVQAGDPYQWQIEQTVAAVLAEWKGAPDWVVCYQSRATSQRWLEPSTEHEIERAAHDKVAVLVVPIAFVSEHSETLVELDEDYRRLAERLGVPGYFRVPTQGADTAFIAALAKLVRSARAHGPGLCSHVRGRFCPADRKLCPVQ